MPATLITAGAAAELATASKDAKYNALLAKHNFVFLVFKTLTDPINITDHGIWLFITYLALPAMLSVSTSFTNNLVVECRTTFSLSELDEI